MVFQALLITLLATLCAGQFSTQTPYYPDNFGNPGGSGFLPAGPISPTYYFAVVVEYSADGHVNSATPSAILANNSITYSAFIRHAKLQMPESNIIVFPEHGLTTVDAQRSRHEVQLYSTQIPSPQSKPNPCDNRMNNVLQVLSCAAKQNSVHVVVNLPERDNCEGKGCPPDRICLFNTNVVFNRQGTIIARYRRSSYFSESQSACDVTKEDPTFHTDFNVTFGILNTHDILHYKPAIELMRKGVADFVYLGAWRSELPFLSAVQIQEGWARGLEVNLLAAGYDDPVNGYGGSGIYPARSGGSTVAMMPHTRQSQFLSSYVQKQRNTRIGQIQGGAVSASISPDSSNYIPQVEFKFLNDNLKPYKTQLLEKSNTSTRLCTNGLCCSFNISAKFPSNKENSMYYRMAVFNGTRKYQGKETIGLQVCSIISCNNSSLSSCGLSMNTGKDSALFEYISIQGEFYNRNSTFMPTTLLNTMLPLTLDAYEMKNQIISGRRACYLRTNGAIRNLQTFGIYSRLFDIDGLPESSEPSGQDTTRQVTSFFGLVILCMLTYFVR